MVSGFVFLAIKPRGGACVRLLGHPWNHLMLFDHLADKRPVQKNPPTKNVVSTILSLYTFG